MTEIESYIAISDEYGPVSISSSRVEAVIAAVEFWVDVDWGENQIPLQTWETRLTIAGIRIKRAMVKFVEE